MTKKLRGILINPKNKTVEEIQIDNADCSTIATTIGAELVELVRVGRFDDLWLDEEGLLQSPNPHGYFIWRGASQIFAGRGLILGHDREGESISTRAPVDLVRAAVEFIDNPDEDAIEPRFGWIAVRA